MNKKQKISGISLILMIWSLLFVLLPMAYVLVISFLERGQNFGFELTPTLQNYASIFNPYYYPVYSMSFKIAILTTLLTIFLGYPFAYGLAKSSSTWKKNVMFLIMAPFWTSSLLRLFGWKSLMMNDGWISRFIQTITFSDTPPQLMFTFTAVMVGMVYALLPIMILSIYNSAEKIDWAQVEAARDLGATPFRAFVSVTLPQTLPGILAGIVLVFVPSMGLYFVTDLMGGSKFVTVGNLIQFEMQNGRNWPFAAALSIAMLIFAALIIYLYTRSSGESDLGELV